MPLGINLTILMGRQVPRPVSRELVEALKSVEVTHTVEGRSGFQMVFKAGRGDRQDSQDYRLFRNPLFEVYNRVILTVSIGAQAQVLMDGVITNQQLSPSPQPGNTTLTLTGEDVSAMMDLEEKSVEHTAQDEATIARMIIGQYTARYGLTPRVMAPTLRDRPTRNERIPAQQETDLQYLQAIAERFAFQFYVTPGPSVGSNIAYWGPPQRQTTPQRALTVNMGSFTNVGSINFQNDAMAATTVDGSVQDRRTNQVRPVQELQSDRPPLAREPALGRQPHHRVRQFRETGRDTAQADARAQAITDRSVDDVVTVTGDLDTIRYGDLLQLRGIVGLRGVGMSYDGLYFVKSVTHTLSKGQYKQSFTITREGLGSTRQRVAI
ncbi:MAG: hypothetical protein VKK04_19080 [Synechococcales bacterium]|nr:hypothetical protein [Synechococcales bacterium]